MENKLALDVKYGTSCDFHRIILPYSCSNITSKVDTIVLNRTFTQGTPYLKKMKRDGWKIILDLDDYWQLNKEHYLYNHYKSVVTDIIVENIKLADIVTVTNTELAEKVKPINQNVVIVHNALPFDEYQFTKSEDLISKSSLVYVAGASHYQDSLVMRGGINPAELTLAGYEENHPEWVKMKDAYHNVRLDSPLPVHNYMKLYDGHKIALAPLVNNEFNRCKSNLKVLEAGAKGIPIVCSKVFPYYNEVDKGTVLYADSKPDWYYLINRLKKDKSFYEDKANSLMEFVREKYNIESANKIRQQVMDSL